MEVSRHVQLCANKHRVPTACWEDVLRFGHALQSIRSLKRSGLVLGQASAQSGASTLVGNPSHHRDGQSRVRGEGTSDHAPGSAERLRHLCSTARS